MERLQDAWRAADIEAYMSLFDEDADLVGRGGQCYRGRAIIAERLCELVKSGRPELFAASRQIESIRLLTPAVAIVHELWLEPDRSAHATYVLTDRDGWRITLATTVLIRS